MNNHQLQLLLQDLLSSVEKAEDAPASAASHLNRAIYNLYCACGSKELTFGQLEIVYDACDEMKYYRSVAEYSRGTESTPKDMYDFFRRLLDPNDLGYAVSGEVRDHARLFLGIPPCESYLQNAKTN